MIQIVERWICVGFVGTFCRNTAKYLALSSKETNQRQVEQWPKKRKANSSGKKTNLSKTVSRPDHKHDSPHVSPHRTCERPRRGLSLGRISHRPITNTTTRDAVPLVHFWAFPDFSKGPPGASVGPATHHLYSCQESKAIWTKAWATWLHVGLTGLPPRPSSRPTVQQHLQARSYGS